MINNSSLGKWNRLKQKNLNQQFVNEMINGLGCSPFEASAILDTVYKVYNPYFESCPSLKPGQMYFEVVSIESKPNTALSDCKMVTVILTLNDEKTDLSIREKEGVIALRQYKLQRIANEAFQQGGLLTVEDIAYRLFNCGVRTISRDIKELKEKGIVLPLRSIVKDMGRAISHRSIIIKEWLAGKEYSNIAKNTHHSISSVRNYVDKFKRVIMLMEEGQEVHTISFLVKISAALVEEYVAIYGQFNIVAHRKKELTEILKKNKNFSENKEGLNDSDIRPSEAL
ncbi:MAG: DUF1670 domain-containing protein [Candidatus Cloacimonetes bacterium]|nr:DUF1670 domain-containing protein [Candidatus Cloacimonadota bacterium]